MNDVDKEVHQISFVTISEKRRAVDFVCENPEGIGRLWLPH